nr:YidB family protein [Acidisarcina polymorpha]
MHRTTGGITMGLLDSIEGMAGEQAGGTRSKVASGLMQALDEHPGGLAGLLDNFKQQGMEDHVQGWATGEQPTATPEQVQQGLGGTGLIERVAEKSGVSPQVAQTAMATVLPMVIAHFTQGGQNAPPQSGFGGMASQILSKLV